MKKQSFRHCCQHRCIPIKLRPLGIQVTLLRSIRIDRQNPPAKVDALARDAFTTTIIIQLCIPLASRGFAHKRLVQRQFLRPTRHLRCKEVTKACLTTRRCGCT